MFSAYWEILTSNTMDKIIVVFGVLLMFAHCWGLFMRFKGTSRFFVQDLDRYRTFLLLLTETLPILGLLGTVFSLMWTFKTFQTGMPGDSEGLSMMIQAFSPALSTTISGLLMSGPNLIFNSFLWLANPTSKERGS
jgi:biopolymer transport protein ExbB/TolQ